MYNTMDTPVEKRGRFNKNTLYMVAGGALALTCILYFIFRDTSSSIKVDKERLTISTVI